MAVPLVVNAWYHAGSAEVALELIANIEDPERRGALAELFTAPPDPLDWTAFSLGARSVVSTLDLCAAAAWRLSDGKPSKGSREKDLDEAFGDHSQLASSPLRGWLVRAHKSDEYPRSGCSGTDSLTGLLGGTLPSYSVSPPHLSSSRRLPSSGRLP